jgi:hypothetical protein
MHKSKIRPIYLFTHSSHLTSNVHEFSNLVEGFDSATTLFSVITFATSCKSSGGVESEGSSFKAISVSKVSAIVNESRKGSLTTVKRYTETGGQSVAEHRTSVTALT